MTANEQRPAKARKVHTALALKDRHCLFCLADDGPFRGEEHVVPRVLGPNTDQFTIPPGVVCDPCNSWLGRQVDAPFTDRFDIRLTRGLEGLRGRSGRPLHTIEGRDATALLELEIEGGKVEIYAARADPSPDGGLDIEIRPQQRDPPDVVARTIRALWKIALGAIWLRDGPEVLDPKYDALRLAVLGAPFNGYLLQAPFVVRVTRRLDVNVGIDRPENPWAMTFILGGVALAVPLTEGAPVRPKDAKEHGWEVRSTRATAPSSIRLRLEPTDPVDLKTIE